MVSFEALNGAAAAAAATATAAAAAAVWYMECS